MKSKPLPKTLLADQYLLRLVSSQDEERVLEIMKDREIARWTTVPYPYTSTNFQQYIEMATTKWNARTGLHLVVVDTNNLVLGATGADLNWETATAAIGYWTAQSERRKGMTTTAASALCDWLTEQGFVRFEAKVLCGNVASGKVLTRLGLQLESINRGTNANGCGLDEHARVDIEHWSKDLTPS